LIKVEFILCRILESSMESISNVSNDLWAVGKQRADVIRPLAEQRRCSRAAIEKAANLLHLSERYVYQLVRNCRASQGQLTSLIPKTSNGGKGRSRLLEQQEALIRESIEDLYLTPQKLSPARIVEEVRKRCTEERLKIPSEATIRRRLCQLSNTSLKVRGENGAVSEPIVGSFPEVEYPLSVVQIDHTLVDIIIVDPIDRLPIGRPYLTLAIDVYSRCIAGFVLSLEAPSAVSVGLCLTHIAMKKDSWLAMDNIDASWPVHGKPRIIHVDNGSDFHSSALTRGCEQHGIRIEYRPLGKPHYGGIIERVIGTLMKLVHTLPGTTFSNTEARGEYNSDDRACLTLSELERWLTIAITKYYHLNLHKGILLPPVKRYENGLTDMKRCGEELAKLQNEKAFLIDFLPIVYRTLRRDGFMLDHITYYAHMLRPFISERTKYGKFLIRRDPRDLSRIYVYLPEEKGYLEVPYRTLSHPAISLFEYRLALKRLRDNGKQQVQEHSLFKAIDEIRNIVTTAASTTRAARRNRTRMHENQKVQFRAITERPAFKNDDNTVTAFADIEVWE
jgi:putative transposase